MGRQPRGTTGIDALVQSRAFKKQTHSCFKTSIHRLKDYRSEDWITALWFVKAFLFFVLIALTWSQKWEWWKARGWLTLSSLSSLSSSGGPACFLLSAMAANCSSSSLSSASATGFRPNKWMCFCKNFGTDLVTLTSLPFTPPPVCIQGNLSSSHILHTKVLFQTYDEYSHSKIRVLFILWLNYCLVMPDLCLQQMRFVSSYQNTFQASRQMQALAHLWLAATLVSKRFKMQFCTL